MKLYKYLFIISLLIIGGCESDGDNITNNYITGTDTNAEELKYIGEFLLQTAVETDLFVVEKTEDTREFYYSNSNSFHFDKDGYLVNSSGFPLMVFPVNQDGSSSSVSIAISEPVRILSYSSGSPEATGNINISVNLPENANELSANEFNINAPLTFNHSTSISVIDSLGDDHVLTFYFIHISVDNNTWVLRLAIDDVTVTQSLEQSLDFGSDGYLDINDHDLDGYISTGNGLIESIAIPLNNGANDLAITLDFTSNTTSDNGDFEVATLESSGFYTGHLNELKIEPDGLMALLYTNGQKELLGRVALAKFLSPYNLEQIGNELWAETEDSGVPLYGEPEAGNFGSIIPIGHDF